MGSSPHVAARRTVEEHKALGAILYDLRNTLLYQCVEVSNKYPLNSELPKLLKASLDKLDSARSKADDYLGDEHPDQFDPAVYYPGGQASGRDARTGPTS